MASLKTASPPAVDRALTILEELARSNRGLRLPELARKLKLPKSSAHSVLLALERRGYLQRHENGRYFFGSKIFTLANFALGGMTIREAAHPNLVALMRRTGRMVHMAILDRSQAVLIEQISPPEIVAPMTWLGKRLELHCTALGKVLAAYLPEGEWDRLIKEHSLSRHNDNTICTPRAFRRELALTRERGYATDNEEVDLGVRCLSVPVFGPEGDAVAAIAISGSTTEIHEGNAESLVALMIAAAKNISTELRGKASAEAG
ncbi:MAG: IclR family transcriptional regulator [Bryobacteraceae bacterium]